MNTEFVIDINNSPTKVYMQIGFFNHNVTVGDLAKELMLSNKQTEREIKRITGNTFIGELSKRRMNAAIMLSQTTKFYVL